MVEFMVEPGTNVSQHASRTHHTPESTETQAQQTFTPEQSGDADSFTGQT